MEIIKSFPDNRKSYYYNHSDNLREEITWMRILAAVICCAVLGIVSGASAQNQTAKPAASKPVGNVIERFQHGNIDWTTGKITARGIGVARKDLSGVQARLMAREAAIVVAQRNLAAIINGVRITSETTVKDAIIESDEIRRSIDGFIRGAEIIRENERPDGAYEVVMTLPMYGQESLAQSVDFGARAILQVDTPEIPDLSAVSEYTIRGDYTGLLIDCRKMKISRVMGPRIYDKSGRDIFGLVKMDPDLAIQKGKAGYYKTVEQAKSLGRVGVNPLVIKAAAITGNRNFPADAVVTDADGALILAENARTGFLEKLAVGFIVD